MKLTRLKNSAFLLLSLLSLIFLISGCTPHSTGSTEVGVRTIKWSFGGLLGKKGVVDKYYAPGSTFFFPPLINDWHTFDTKLQNMEMTLSASRGDRKKRDDLLFKTIDGNDISLDVIVSFRVKPENAPQILQEGATSSYLLKEKIVRPITRGILRDVFGELKTEEFYIADKRSEKAKKAVKISNQLLNPLGIIVEKVLTKDYRFNPAYQKAIEDKKIADQRAEQNKSAAKAALEEYRKKLAEAGGTYNQIVAKVDGQYRQAVIKADAYYEQQGKIA